MSRIRLTKNFFLDEFVPPEIYNERGAKSSALLDIRIIQAAQYLRDKIGKPIHINNWWNGGALDERGLRIFNTSTGAKWSAHKYGRAIDISVDGYSPKDLLKIVMQDEAYLIENQMITTVENPAFTRSWLHLDCRYTGLDRILIVDP